MYLTRNDDTNLQPLIQKCDNTLPIGFKVSIDTSLPSRIREVQRRAAVKNHLTAVSPVPNIVSKTVYSVQNKQNLPGAVKAWSTASNHHVSPHASAPRVLKRDLRIVVKNGINVLHGESREGPNGCWNHGRTRNSFQQIGNAVVLVIRLGILADGETLSLGTRDAKQLPLIFGTDNINLITTPGL